MKHAFAALALLATSGCLSLEDPEPELGTIAYRPDPGGPTCPTWGCGLNSATVGDGLLFDEFDSSGNEANRGGLKYISAAFDITHTPVRLFAYRHWLYAYSMDWSTPYSGSSLVGLVITLNHPVNGNYEIKITAYDDNMLKFWAGTNEGVPFYELMTRRQSTGGKFKEYACRDELLSDPMWVGLPHRAVVFQGDRYDSKYKTARDVGDSDPWFNVACAATAPAKMHLMRHTRAGGNYSWSGTAEYPTSDSERTALLKMFTADYCGNGHTFTVDGRPLAYQDSAHWKMEMGAYTHVESLWTATGASCLHKPRWVDANMVYAECGHVLPECPANLPPVPAGPAYDWESVAHAFSAIP